MQIVDTWWPLARIKDAIDLLGEILFFSNFDITSGYFRKLNGSLRGKSEPDSLYNSYGRLQTEKIAH